MASRAVRGGHLERVVLRPPGAAGLVVAVLLVTLAVGVSGAGASAGLLLPAGLALGLCGAFVLPSLRVDGSGLVVRGVVRRHVVPWGAVAVVRQGWFLTLDLLDGRRLVCLAVPVVGSMLDHRSWTVDEDNDMFLRDSTRARPFPGARSLALELVLAHRPPPAPGGAGRGATGAVATGAAVRTTWRPSGLAVVSVAGVAVVAGVVARVVAGSAAG